MKNDSARATGSVLDRALSSIRPGCQTLLAPHAVVLDAGAGAPLAIRLRSHPTESLEAQFSAAVAELLQLMDQAGLRGRRLQLVVSDFWVRPMVLPLIGKLPSDADIDIVLQSQYRRTYGELMDGWHWCWAVQDARLLAAAWPAAGLAALREGMAQRGCILAQARPLAIDIASNALGDDGSSWLAILEQHSFTLVRQQNGVWQDWCVTPIDTEMATNLPLQLARETARRQDACRSVTLVDLTGVANTKLIRTTLTDEGWTLRVWASNQANASTGYRLQQAITSGTPA